MDYYTYCYVICSLQWRDNKYSVSFKKVTLRQPDGLLLLLKTDTLAAQPRGAPTRSVAAEMLSGKPLEPDPDYAGGGMVLTPQAGVISVF